MAEVHIKSLGDGRSANELRSSYAANRLRLTPASGYEHGLILSPSLLLQTPITGLIVSCSEDTALVDCSVLRPMRWRCGFLAFRRLRPSRLSLRDESSTMPPVLMEYIIMEGIILPIREYDKAWMSPHDTSGTKRQCQAFQRTGVPAYSTGVREARMELVELHLCLHFSQYLRYMKPTLRPLIGDYTAISTHSLCNESVQDYGCAPSRDMLFLRRAKVLQLISRWSVLTLEIWAQSAQATRRDNTSCLFLSDRSLSRNTGCQD